MPKFTLYLVTGKSLVAEGETIAEACAKALSRQQLALIDSYDPENGERVQVATKATCGCCYHAMDGFACDHDLELAGIIPDLGFNQNALLVSSADSIA